MSSGRLVETVDIPRTRPDGVCDERESLAQWLDFHRATFQLKCAGLTDAQLKLRPLAPSSLSLLGLLRHLTEVERGWFVETLAGEAATPLYTSADPEGDFDNLDSEPVEQVWASYRSALRESGEVFASFGTADELRRNEAEREVNVRWVMMHLVEEYARHNGHADLLREAIDGSTGD
jgi:uncharacterized damage-inducible protein DinB